MSSIQSDLMQFLSDGFITIDNTPEDFVQRDQLIMEARASLLIEANCTGERFPAFMKCGRRSFDGWIYKFTESFVRTLPFPSGCSSTKITWIIAEFEINTSQIIASESGVTFDRWKLYCPEINNQPTRYSKLEQPNQYVRPDSTQYTVSNYQESFKELEKEFYKNYRPLYLLCSQISPYKTPESVCRFWGNAGVPFAKLKCRGMWPEIFHADDVAALTSCDSAETELYKVHEQLRDLVPCGLIKQLIPQNHSKYYDDWFCLAYPFKNRHGEVTMQLIKLYDIDNQAKVLLPVTSWGQNNCAYSQLFCVPVPEDKQPLFNLDLLSHKDCETVILTDSVELADANQRNAPRGIVFTSFISQPGHYEHVDWSPLRDKKIYLLVTNHSGIRMDATVLKMRELSEFLLENEDITLTYIFAPVTYSDTLTSRGRAFFKKVDDVLDYYRDNKPQLCENDIKIIDDDEFEELCKKAEINIASYPLEWWQDLNESKEQERIVEKNNTNKIIDYVMFPILERGEATMMYAGKSLGKSSLAYSIAGRIVVSNYSTRPTPLLAEKWWTVPKTSKHKVLYLDFENKDRIKTLRKDYLEPYLPKDKFEECNSDVIIEDMSNRAKNFADPGNHQKIIDMLEAAKKQGTPGIPVDLLVIDTYTAFVGTENPATPEGFRTLVNRVRDMKIAVLIITHANSEGEVRGLKSKFDNFSFVFKMYREDNRPDALDEPFTIEYREIRGPLGSALRKPFDIRYSNDDKHWLVDQPVSDENHELALIVKDFKRANYPVDSIRKMLGLEKSAFNERLKKAKSS